MAYNIGSMFQRAGETIGTSIGQPISSVGTSIGGMLTRSAEREREKNAEEQFQQIMAAHQNNPAELQRQGLRAKASGDKNLQRIGDMLLDEARRAQTVLEKQASRTTASVDRARSRYDALVAARPEMDTAFDEARTFRRTLKDARDRVLNEDGSPKKGATDKEKRLYRALQTRSITAEEYAKEMLKDQEVSVTYKKLVDADGVEKEFKIINNKETGQEISREPLGPVAQSAGKDPLTTAHGLQALEDARGAAGTAMEKAAKLENAADYVASRGFFDRGIFGGALSSAKEMAGIGDEVSVFRRELAEIRMSGVLGMLPPGVASDRDVQLALDTQIDFNNVEDDVAEAILRGMVKIQRAKQEYHEQKVRWINKTRDPSAAGFDLWAKSKEADNKLEELKTGPAFQSFYAELTSATNMPAGEAKDARLAAINQMFPKEMNTLEQIKQARSDWEEVENKPSGF